MNNGSQRETEKGDDAVRERRLSCQATSVHPLKLRRPSSLTLSLDRIPYFTDARDSPISVTRERQVKLEVSRRRALARLNLQPLDSVNEIYHKLANPAREIDGHGSVIDKVQFVQSSSNLLFHFFQQYKSSQKQQAQTM